MPAVPISVELIGHYGGDETHALSAWTSTTRDLEAKRERIPALLKMLAEEGHHTPFEKSTLHFLVKCDKATHIQIIKHRVGVSVNAESARYKELKSDEYYVPEDWAEDIQDALKSHTEDAIRAYHWVLEASAMDGLDRKRAKESARYFLPHNMMIVQDVSFNFRSFMHFLGLRLKPDAQREVYLVADLMLQSVRSLPAFRHSLVAYGYDQG